MEGIFPGFLEQLMFDGDECGLTETLKGQNHPIGQQAVHQDPAASLSNVDDELNQALSPYYPLFEHLTLLRFFFILNK